MSRAYQATCDCGANARTWTRPDANTFLRTHTCRTRPDTPPTGQKRARDGQTPTPRTRRGRRSRRTFVDAPVALVDPAPQPASVGWWVHPRGAAVPLGPFDDQAEADAEAADIRADGDQCTVLRVADATAASPAA